MILLSHNYPIILELLDNTLKQVNINNETKFLVKKSSILWYLFREESIIFKENNATYIIKVEFIQNKQMKILVEFQECRELRPFLTKHIPGICLR